MEEKRFTEAQVTAVLKEAEGAEAARDVCRRHAICEQTFYRWKQKCGGMEISEAKRLKALEQEQENERLKRMMAALSLDKQMLEETVGKSGEPALEVTGGRALRGSVRSHRTAGP